MCKHMFVHSHAGVCLKPLRKYANTLKKEKQLKSSGHLHYQEFAVFVSGQVHPSLYTM